MQKIINNSRRLLRGRRLMEQAIKKLNLDLRNLIILTESASGNYIFTSLIAGMAGAKKVYAFTKNSKYATIEEVVKNTYSFANYLNIRKRIKIITKLSSETISRADIITNLGFLRPINKKFILSLKSTAVIPLMFETWEYREKDLDIKECFKKEIPVLGTNEKDARLRIFEYLGPLCLKKLFDLGIEIFQSKIIVIGQGIFGRNISKTLNKIGAETLNIGHQKKCYNKNLKNCDVIIVTTHLEKKMAIGGNGYIKPKDVAKLCPDVTILGLTGKINRKALDKFNILYLPKKDPGPGIMAFTDAEIGPKPTIDSHTAGLKVGEIMARLRLKGFSRKKTIQMALKNPLCQDFDPTQKKKYFYDPVRNYGANEMN